MCLIQHCVYATTWTWFYIGRSIDLCCLHSTGSSKSLFFFREATSRTAHTSFAVLVRAMTWALVSPSQSADPGLPMTSGRALHPKSDAVSARRDPSSWRRSPTPPIRRPPTPPPSRRALKAKDEGSESDPETALGVAELVPLGPSPDAVDEEVGVKFEGDLAFLNVPEDFAPLVAKAEDDGDVDDKDPFGGDDPLASLEAPTATGGDEVKVERGDIEPADLEDYPELKEIVAKSMLYVNTDDVDEYTAFKARVTEAMKPQERKAATSGAAQERKARLLRSQAGLRTAVETEEERLAKFSFNILMKEVRAVHYAARGASVPFPKAIAPRTPIVNKKGTKPRWSGPPPWRAPRLDDVGTVGNHSSSSGSGSQPKYGLMPTPPPHPPPPPPRHRPSAHGEPLVDVSTTVPPPPPPAPKPTLAPRPKKRPRFA